jgi:hypothetical protein
LSPSALPGRGNKALFFGGGKEVKKNIGKEKAPTTAETIADMAQALRAVEKALEPMGGRLSPDAMEISAYLTSVKPLIYFDLEKLRSYLDGAMVKSKVAAKKPPVSDTRKQAKSPVNYA